MRARKKLTRISIFGAIVAQLLILCATASLLVAQTHLQSADGYVRREGNDWVIGTSSVERRIRFDDGHLELVSLRNKVTAREYRNAGTPPAEIRFSANDEDVSASGWRWKLRGEHAVQASQGALQLDIDLESASLRATKHYVVYPGTSVIREWLTLENISDKPVRISHVEFLHASAPGSMAQDLQFNYLTGGGNYNGSQLLKTEPISPQYHADSRFERWRSARQLQQFPASGISARSQE